MKSTTVVSCLILLSAFEVSAAFAPMLEQSSSVTRSRDTAMSASRRNILETATAAAALLFPTVASAEPRPMYLTEPTAEFKESEAKAAEFKRQQLQVKKDFVAVLDRLTNESNDEDALVKDLNDIKALVAKTGGLPLGIKKEELFKIIRTKKAQGFWPTPVEVA